MLQALQVLSLLLGAAAFSFALAHAAELPGKLRVDRRTYLAVQGIYYPGFTIGGLSEPAAIIALALLLAFTPRISGAFWFVAAALGCSIAMQVVYWVRTHPVNKVWLRDESMARTARGFFTFDGGGDGAEQADWKVLRARWESSHVLRAILAAASLALLAVAVTGPS